MTLMRYSCAPTEGTLEPVLWEAHERVILSYFHKPGIQEWWGTRAQAYSTEFQAFLDESEPPQTDLQTTQQLVDEGRLPGPNPPSA